MQKYIEGQQYLYNDFLVTLIVKGENSNGAYGQCVWIINYPNGSGKGWPGYVGGAHYDNLWGIFCQTDNRCDLAPILTPKGNRIIQKKEIQYGII
jgi:hypothetical protein